MESQDTMLPAAMRGKSTCDALSLSELSAIISGQVTVPETRDVWVTGEFSDFNTRSGHAYFDFVEKDLRGQTVARIRGIIWANTFYALNARFRAVTGSPLTDGQKVMVKASVNFHAAYGLSLIVSDVNPEFTLGDRLLRRAANVARLEKDGILMMNKSLPLPPAPLRIAIVASATSAGYGDFMRELTTGSGAGFRFTTELFEARVQGNEAPADIIAALDEIGIRFDDFDCTVIIRGGGASDDLSCFEDYDLAANVAQFPLPVIIGIGHERDVTLLDYVAAVRVKTPTAAAVWLAEQIREAIERVERIGSDIASRIRTAMESAHTTIENCRLRLSAQTHAILTRQYSLLDSLHDRISILGKAATESQHIRLEGISGLLDALRPEAVMRRGFSVTRHNGRPILSADAVKKGDRIVTILADKSTIESSIL